MEGNHKIWRPFDGLGFNTKLHNKCTVSHCPQTCYYQEIFQHVTQIWHIQTQRQLKSLKEQVLHTQRNIPAKCVRKMLFYFLFLQKKTRKNMALLTATYITDKKRVKKQQQQKDLNERILFRRWSHLLTWGSIPGLALSKLEPWLNWTIFQNWNNNGDLNNNNWKKWCADVIFFSKIFCWMWDHILEF